MNQTLSHTAPCDKVIEAQVNIARVEEQQKSDHSWIEDIDKDKEEIKKDVNQIKVDFKGMQVKLAIILSAAVLLSNLVFKFVFDEGVKKLTNKAVQVVPSANAGTK